MHRRHGNGALAQLGERLLCKHQVIGSIPIGSTSFAVQDNVRGTLSRKTPERKRGAPYDRAQPNHQIL